MKKILYAIALIVVIILIITIYNNYFSSKESKIYSIPSETSKSEGNITYRFVISSPPKTRDELLKLTDDYTNTLNLASNNYYLIFFKESKSSPINFNADKNIPTRCNRNEREESCMEYDDIIISISKSGDYTYITLRNNYKYLNNKECSTIRYFQSEKTEIICDN